MSKRYSASITLSAKQIDLLNVLIDSYEEGRSGRNGGDGGDSITDDNSASYRDVDRFVKILLAKLRIASDHIERSKNIDEQLQRVRNSLGIGKKSKA